MMKIGVVLMTTLVMTLAVAPDKFERAEFIPVVELSDSPISSHIIAGSPATLGQFPWQAALLLSKQKSKYICGGIVVHQNWILTAGHCTKGASSVFVRLGSLNYNAGGTTYTVSARNNIFTHASYNDRTLVNDVGLIRIPTITESANIKPIKVLPLAITTFPGNLTVSGWGRACDQNTAACSAGQFLNYVHLLHKPLNECQAVYGSATVTDSVICTTRFTSGKENICSGDSGGPLVQLGSTNYLVGVVSFGSSAGCEQDFPAGYSYANKFCAWMQTIAKTTICVA